MASIISPINFKPVCIPLKNQFIDIFENPVAIPVDYLDKLREKYTGLAQIRQIVLEKKSSNFYKEFDKVSSLSFNSAPEVREKSADGRDTISPIITGNFLDWLVSSPGKCEQLFDLVRLDSEKLAPISSSPSSSK